MRFQGSGDKEKIPRIYREKIDVIQRIVDQNGFFNNTVEGKTQ
jgi:hypothetical protein